MRWHQARVGRLLRFLSFTLSPSIPCHFTLFPPTVPPSRPQDERNTPLRQGEGFQASLMLVRLLSGSLLLLPSPEKFFF